MKILHNQHVVIGVVMDVGFLMVVLVNVELGKL
jgi:hypothetical protein